MQRLALAMAGALVGLTSCSQAAPSAAPPATHRAPISCSEQYRTWTSGDGQGVMRAIHDVSTAAKTVKGTSLTATLEKARPAVAQGTRHPIPACADPRGYWSVLLMHLNAAALGKGSSAGVRAALRDVPMIHRRLVAEIRQTAVTSGKQD